MMVINERYTTINRAISAPTTTKSVSPIVMGLE